MQNYSISVIIPFYNARDFVTQAVHSALEQPETGEVLLIEDNSPDGGLEVCESLANLNEKVFLLRHPDGGNHGAGASRNLGIINASFPYIAFLDADDYFLPGRFYKTRLLFNSDISINGVYNAIGAHFEKEADKELFSTTFLQTLTTVTKIVPPEQLFRKMIGLGDGVGYFSLDSVTVKKELFEKTGLFNEELRFHEDTDMMYKMVAVGKMLPGEIQKPVAIRRVHGNNRITQHLVNKRNLYMTNYDLFSSLIIWGKNNLPKEYQNLIAIRFVERLRKADYFDDHTSNDYMISRKKMIKIAYEFPTILLNHWFWRMLIPSKSLFKSRNSH